MLCPGSCGAAEVTPDGKLKDSSCDCRAAERSQPFSGWEAGQDETEGNKKVGLSQSGKVYKLGPDSPLGKNCEFVQAPDALGSQMSFDGSFGKHQLKKKSCALSS